MDPTSLHTPALFLDKSNPYIWKALNATALKVQAATDAAGLSRDLVELVNVRISQMNGCAFCLDLHSRLAAEAGVPIQKLQVLPAWRRTDLFSVLERAALTVAEAVTDLPDEEELVEELSAARTMLSDEQYSALSWVAVVINAFNRVSIISRHPVRRRP
ncbi:MAG TPA: carboxymuconolactone decarboxylase [Arthrobacter bacterium]|jgi:AhpD family alkylhydroperoxidase|nr:carboxymuconolactone decarboxylase [Arthrobacter sp.]